MSINLIDVLSQPTKIRPENLVKEVVTDQIKERVLDPLLKPRSAFAEEELDDFEELDNPEQEEQDEQTAEQSADALIDMIDLLQKGIFGIWGTKRLKAKFPPALMEEFVAIDLKDMCGEDITDEEKKKLDRYRAFDRRCTRLLEEIPFTKEEREDLKAATKAFVQKQKIKIPPSVWFFTQVASKLSERMIEVMTI